MNITTAIVTGLLVATSGGTAHAKDTRFWNLTAETITHLQFSAPGKNAWGTDQCKNDKDGSVDHDERLKIVGLTSGTYDAKLSDKGRTCIVRNVALVEGAVFSIDDKALTDCH